MDSQRKGADGERELAGLLREYGYEIERGGSLSFGEVPDLTGLPGVHIEVKRVERLNVQEAMEQAIRDSERFGDGMPALFHRRNHKPWLVTMRIQDWMELYQKRDARPAQKCREQAYYSLLVHGNVRAMYRGLRVGNGEV